MQEIIEIHRLLIAEFGGAKEIRDLGALDAALLRPQLGYYETLIEQAAALMESLANNHPFVDGNKRVAFFITDTFLRMNDFYINCDSQEAYRHFMTLFAESNFNFAELHNWLKIHITKLPAEEGAVTFDLRRTTSA